jgi:hypothetical protein
MRAAILAATVAASLGASTAAAAGPEVDLALVLAVPSIA